MEKKKTILALVLVAAATTVFAMAKPTEESTPDVKPSNESDIAGVYTLVTVDGVNIPGNVDHGGHGIMLHSGEFTINADGTCISKTVFSPPSGEKIVREVKATYTRKEAVLTMNWEGAGMTEGTVKGDTFTMNNEGMIFVYKK